MDDLNSRFHLIATGGTIDSYYNVDSCTPECFEESVLPHYLQQHAMLSRQSFQFTQLCMKDSRDISPQDREAMVERICSSPERSIVLTHGSFTVFETARYIADRQGSFTDKTVILTGALKPIDGFVHGDGLFNLGAAILASQHAKPGIYVCIEGQLYLPSDRENWH
ncbi:asparaginase [Motiliproteus coralliicola]|uniref:Asparaginase n=1 Tax=Motiliproteus coralliicola TaxID=2283196 RepID=A0A369WSY8_9GAMM|nr:asparaginase domain-containing protein [Motiliproteus coralliicola]RDE22605.1 asparaginase [Motiliproteus coralliicola]